LLSSLDLRIRPLIFVSPFGPFFFDFLSLHRATRFFAMDASFCYKNSSSSSHVYTSPIPGVLCLSRNRSLVTPPLEEDSLGKLSSPRHAPLGRFPPCAKHLARFKSHPLLPDIISPLRVGPGLLTFSPCCFFPSALPPILERACPSWKKVIYDDTTIVVPFRRRYLLRSVILLWGRPWKPLVVSFGSFCYLSCPLFCHHLFNAPLFFLNRCSPSPEQHFFCFSPPRPSLPCFPSHWTNVFQPLSSASTALPVNPMFVQGQWSFFPPPPLLTQVSFVFCLVSCCSPCVRPFFCSPAPPREIILPYFSFLPNRPLGTVVSPPAPPTP